MGEWNTIFDGEVEGRQVAVKVYRSSIEADQEDDEGPAVRVTTTSIDEFPGGPEDDGNTLLVQRQETARFVTLEPYSLDDLEGELMEVGFSPEAATTIARKVPV
ncbi:hypothetical protein [Microvirga mediterraneensis]|uniref:Uncharacterized protein n=1 Tax=Microvirga mediterraneensis TaxID=2754695 RepID=A0A838BUU0_9HYPH|nr:hypothetical protein [Microvirga mediterraneensis]MBA1159118.1 hypothetical protein [Microvirga mediterraneensis]